MSAQLETYSKQYHEVNRQVFCHCQEAGDKGARAGLRDAYVVEETDKGRSWAQRGIWDFRLWSKRNNTEKEIQSLAEQYYRNTVARVICTGVSCATIALHSLREGGEGVSVAPSNPSTSLLSIGFPKIYCYQHYIPI